MPIYYANLIFFVNINILEEGAVAVDICGKTIYGKCHRIIASHGLHESVMKIIITPETGTEILGRQSFSLAHCEKGDTNED